VSETRIADMLERMESKQIIRAMRWKCLAAVLMVAAVASAQDQDLSSPKGAAKALAAAVARGDAEAIRGLIYVENDPQQQLVNSYANLILAAKRLGAAAKKRFPGVASPFTSGGIAPEEAAAIDAADVRITGDTATLKIQAREQVRHLRKVGETWKVIVSEEPAGQNPELIIEQAARVQALAEALGSSADDIAAGRFRDADEARNAVRQRLAGAALKLLPSTTNPATHPAAPQ
jgi:hypothetical protein